MRIKRFLENAQMDISSDRVEEILKELKELTAYLDDKNKSILSLTTELNNYKNKSQKFLLSARRNPNVDYHFLRTHHFRNGVGCIRVLRK